MLLLGLTGGIGSGKSTAAAMLGRRGAVVLDADGVAREVVEPGGPAYQPVIDRFGSGVVRADRTFDRAAIAAIVFHDPLALADLNALTHPAIRAVIGARVAALAGSDEVVVVDTPLLAETTDPAWGMAGVIVVDVPVEVAVRRLVGQRGLPEEDARARIAVQASREERRRSADFVIDNSGDVASLEREVDRCWAWLMRLRG